MPNHRRKIGSIKNELILKSKESMLAAVQVFNNPNFLFKAESFTVLAIISWTYLLHAFYRNKKIDYRYYKLQGQRKKYDTTKMGSYKYWELERCLSDSNTPIDKITSSNLKFLIGLRHEIEHQMTTRIDDLLSARFQACCLNYNEYLKKLFPSNDGIEKYLSFSLQFSSLNQGHSNQLKDFQDLPENIFKYVQDFDNALPESDFNDNRFSYRVLFVPKIVNRKGQADKVIEFIPADSEIAVGMNKEYVFVKEKEKTKYLATDICRKMQELGYLKFKVNNHTLLWKEEDAKDTSKGYGTLVVRTWYWYDTWLSHVQEYCEQNATVFV